MHSCELYSTACSCSCPRHHAQLQCVLHSRFPTSCTAQFVHLTVNSTQPPAAAPAPDIRPATVPASQPLSCKLHTSLYTSLNRLQLLLPETSRPATVHASQPFSCKLHAPLYTSLKRLQLLLPKAAHCVQLLCAGSRQCRVAWKCCCVCMHGVADAFVYIRLHIGHCHQHHRHARPQVVGPDELQERHRVEVAGSDATKLPCWLCTNSACRTDEALFKDQQLLLNGSLRIHSVLQRCRPRTEGACSAATQHLANCMHCTYLQIITHLADIPTV